VLAHQQRRPVARVRRIRRAAAVQQAGFWRRAFAHAVSETPARATAAHGAGSPGLAARAGAADPGGERTSKSSFF
jgi:hypothetical protein